MSETEQATENKTVMCLGAPILPNVMAEIKKMPRPQIGDLRWNDPRNWFINFQSFFQIRSGIDILKLKAAVTDKIFYKYFPILLQPREVVLSPNTSKPRSLELKLDIMSLKDPRANVKELMVELQEDLREVLKETSQSYQSIECDPSLILARIPKEMHADPVMMEKLLKLRNLKPYTEKFYLETAYLVRVTKDDFGLEYEYTEIKES